MAWNEDLELKSVSTGQQWKDIRQAMSAKDGRPKYCPVRIATVWRKTGDACGNREIEPAQNEAGEIIGYRCALGHVFGNPRSAS